MITWLAMWALVLNALLPAIAQAAVHASGSADIFEVCTSTGMIRVKVPDHHPAAAEKSMPGYDLSQHCPLCALHAGAAGMPPSTTILVDSTYLSEMPAAFYQAQFRSSVWLPAHSRAPPHLI